MAKKQNWETDVLKYQSGKKKGEVRAIVMTLLAKELGAKGGAQRARNLSKKQLSEIGKQGAAKRWAKKGGK